MRRKKRRKKRMKQRQRESEGEFSRKFVRQKMRRQACHIQLSTKLQMCGCVLAVLICRYVYVYVCEYVCACVPVSNNGKRG